MPPVVIVHRPFPASSFTVVAAADGDHGDDQKSVAEPEKQTRQVKTRHMCRLFIRSISRESQTQDMHLDHVVVCNMDNC